MTSFRLAGRVQHYAWGTTDEIPRRLGRAPDGRPWAEYWLGAHPSAPATALVDDVAPSTLDAVVATDPEAALGAPSVARFGPTLPFLLKILSAATPLSIQCHPTAEQARRGFDDEEARGVPLDAPIRTYRDPFAKPELLVALTPFVALKGFRAPTDIARLFRRIGGGALDTLADEITSLPEAAALARVLAFGLGLDGEEKRAVLAGLDRGGEAHVLPEAALVRRLRALHPDDGSVVVALALRLVVLAPGEGIFLGPGELHAYVEGTGLELMKSSDNVLRGGLTPKHVDRIALQAITRFVVDDGARLRPRPLVGPFTTYDTPAPEVTLLRATLTGEMYALPCTTPCIVLALEGEIHVEDEAHTITLGEGESAFVTARARREDACVGGTGEVAIATVRIDDAG